MLDNALDWLENLGLTGETMVSLLQIIWIDLLLSGDNAVVIALACRSLPVRQRRIGILLGTATAIGLRILFALIITQLLALPFLRLIGGVLLLWIAVKLVAGEDESEAHVTESETLWQAVRTIAIADAVMSLDNVVAISAAADGHVWLFVFGLLFSIPLIIVGSTLIMALVERFPLFVWGGAALLGWIAGEMIVSDPWIEPKLPPMAGLDWHIWLPLVGLAFVILAGFVAKRSRERRAASG